MSKYTTEVRFICEQLTGHLESVGYSDIDDVVTEAIPKVFDFDFPLFDPDYKPVLCRKILMHYYTREIGLETYGLWKHFLKTKLNEIMPYYNGLYESAAISFDPLRDVDLTTVHTGKNTGNNQRERLSGAEHTEAFTGNTNSTNENENHVTTDNAFSATPQGTLSNVKDLTYLTDFREIKEDAMGEGSTNTTTTTNRNATDHGNENETTVLNSTDEFLRHLYGKTPGKSFSKMIMEYRESLLNIDKMIIDELRDLFMNIW